MGDARLNHKLKALKRRVALIEAVADFLQRNPAIASRCELQQMGNTVGLYFDGRARIRPVGKQQIALRLEKYFEDWDPIVDNDEKRLVCADLSALSSEELALVLKQVGVDLSKPKPKRDEYPEDALEDEE